MDECDPAVNSDTHDVTRLLAAVSAGDRVAEPALYQRIYDELRCIARARMFGERHDHTLQATALVNEAYLRLLGSSGTPWDDRAHFYGAAVAAMRRILIDYARARGAKKRGGLSRRVALVDADLGAEAVWDEVLDLDDAIERLAAEDETKAQLVRLRFYAGLDMAEAARTLKLSIRTAERHWTYARAWLFAILAPGEAAE